MQHTVTGNHVGTFSTRFLPMIDMNPTTHSCVYTTLKFIRPEAQRLNIDVLVVTFDHNRNVNSKPDEFPCLVIRLGGFHTLMSFLGSIGEIMTCSVIEEVLPEVYAEDTIPHLMSGKAYSLFQTLNDAIKWPALIEIIESLEKRKLELSKDSRTAKLWIIYLNMFDVAKAFIWSEKTRNFEMHLNAVENMLPIFASSGHNNYAKYARVYIQYMRELEKKYERIFYFKTT
ncbi:hypothetical protein PR048_020056 [Dryococelus australis]|uniref:Uncharacterized protein n=1 Tax=Dryococelus australis TaxID=614101 RepID=A0ABQ9H589_9NEOP|nr:hypothetical protein PR048_020056 [Dryococelus australis]